VDKIVAPASKQRVALIGLGMAVTPLARALRDLSDRVEIINAHSPTPARREAFGQNFDFPLAERLETILEDRSVEAVLILTPPNTHLDLVRRCAAAGKHILLEKPIEITTARAEALVAATRASGVRLGIVLQNRYRPACLASPSPPTIGGRNPITTSPDGDARATAAVCC
jgi:UDP-N-acetyl-2-amino-2-deoxyglucuronate dehydrogenase